MLKIDRNTIYRDHVWVCQIDASRDVVSEFIGHVSDRTGRFSLGKSSIQDIAVGSESVGLFRKEVRSLRAVVVEFAPRVWLKAIYVGMAFDSYAKFGVYMHGLYGGTNARETLASSIKNFDELLEFNAFDQVSELILEQVVTGDLALSGARPRPRS